MMATDHDADSATSHSAAREGCLGTTPDRDRRNCRVAIVDGPAARRRDRRGPSVANAGLPRLASHGPTAAGSDASGRQKYDWAIHGAAPAVRYKVQLPRSPHTAPFTSWPNAGIGHLVCGKTNTADRCV